MKRGLLLFWSLLLSASTWAQNSSVSGKVTSPDGESLPGVNVVLKGTTTGTITDSDGNYKLDATVGTLVFSFIGYQVLEIPIDNRSVVDVKMEEDLTTLEQVVVVGYGTQKKKDLTTSVAIVDQTSIKDRPLTSAAEALQGKAAGVQVTQTSGKPGGEISIRVRGATSVQAGNEPLYVVDGVPTTDIRGINANDIESMSVLKDASSAAIYGARAANGVVLITTKRGKANVPQLQFMANVGVTEVTKKLDVLNTDQYRQLMSEINNVVVDPTITQNTDWQDETYGTGSFQNYQLSYSGGTDKSQYYVSGGYLNNKGVIRPSEYNRYTLRLNLDNQVKEWLKMGTNFNFVRSKYKNTEDNKTGGRGGVILSALTTPPSLPIYNPDGSGQFAPNPYQSSWENPVAFMEGADEGTTDDRLIGNLNAEVKILEGLSFKTNFGVDYTVHRNDYYLDPFRTSFGRSPTNHGLGRTDQSTTFAWLSENMFSYTKAVGVHSFNALAGMTVQESTWERTYIEGKDFPNVKGVQTLNAANQIVSAFTEATDWAIASFLARANYDYDGKYLLTATLRRDGSSRFASGRQWGTFPSVSAGWRISAEPFMQSVAFVNDLKLRAGWGKNGNQEGINNYASYTQSTFGRGTSTPANPGPGINKEETLGGVGITWEETTQTNIGIDFSILNSRLTFTIDGYLKKTDGLLLDVGLPEYTGFRYVRRNAGKIENKGLEFAVSSINVDKDLRWTTDFNISMNRNKVTDLQLNKVYYYAPMDANGGQNLVRLTEGGSLGTFFGYIYEGVKPDNGDPIYHDFTGNGVSDQDRTVIGNAQPNFIFGLTNNFSYKRFDLNIFLQGSQGNDIYNATRMEMEGMLDTKNQSTAVLNRWTENNRNTGIPRAGIKTEGIRNSTRFVEDGSYLRVKSVTLSYNVNTSPLEKLGINKLSVYATGQNLLTWTNYSGYDPEVNAYSTVTGRGTEIGIDYGTYPQSRTIILGLNVSF